MTFVRRLLIAGLGLWLAACASTPDEQAPAELTDFTQERGLQRLWSRSIGNGQGGSFNRLVPAVADDVLYAVSANGRLQALDYRKGKLLWQRKLDEPVSGGVGTGEGRLLLGTAEGDVLSLDAADGSELWRQRLSGEVLAAPQTDGQLVVAQTYDGHVVALDADSGELRWSYAATVPLLTLRGTSTPMIVGNLVVAGLANGRVVALDLETGALRWEQRVAIPKGSTEIERISDVDGNLLLDNGIVYAVGYQGKVMAIEARSGRRLWERDASAYVGPAAGYSNIYVVTADGTVNAYQETGQGVTWSQTVLARRQLTQPAILSGSLAVGDFEGYLHFLSQVDGHLVARDRADDEGLRAPMLVHDNILFVYGNSGKLVAYQFDSSATGTTGKVSRRKGPRR